MYGEPFNGRQTAQHQLQWSQIKSLSSFMNRDDTEIRKRDFYIKILATRASSFYNNGHWSFIVLKY